MAVANSSEPEFLDRLRGRDPAAWEAIVDTYLPQLLRTGRGMGFSADETQDLAQSVFVALMENIGRFEGRSHIRTFLFGIRRFVLSFAALWVVASISLAAPKTHKGKTFSGEIMDSQCAMMGSHDPAGYKMTKTDNPKDCTLACVKMGGKFVLYDSAKKTTYALDDQEKPKEFAGQKVKVSGTYDKASKTIHVESIEAGS
jgi:hypothetical protein